MKKSLLALLLLSACSSPDPASQLTKEKLGTSWPFAVDAVEVGCDKGRTFVETPDGRKFALNGLASGAQAADGSKECLNLDEIWLPDPANGPGGHKDLTGVMEAANKECEN